MPFCKTTIPFDSTQSSSLVINKIAQYFDSERAILLPNGHWNIDAGINNIRAVVCEDKQLIKFCFRYEKDREKYEKLIKLAGNQIGNDCS